MQLSHKYFYLDGFQHTLHSLTENICFCDGLYLRGISLIHYDKLASEVKVRCRAGIIIFWW
jgi:hypothetical protein